MLAISNTIRGGHRQMDGLLGSQHAFQSFYSFDDKTYTMMRNAWMQDNTPIQVGVMAACPDGQGFNVKFENFKVKHLPDKRRLEWLKNNQE